MSKILTYEKKNPGNFLYGSRASQQELVEKLGQIEHQGEDLLGEVCDYCCMHTIGTSEAELQEHCEKCPLTKLADLIGL